MNKNSQQSLKLASNFTDIAIRSLFYLRLVGGIIKLRGEVKTLVVIVIPAIILVGVLLFGLSDTIISIADTSIPDNEVANSINKANNSASAIAAIVIYVLPYEIF